MPHWRRSEPAANGGTAGKLIRREVRGQPLAGKAVLKGYALGAEATLLIQTGWWGALHRPRHSWNSPTLGIATLAGTIMMLQALQCIARWKKLQCGCVWAYSNCGFDGNPELLHPYGTNLSGVNCMSRRPR